MPQVLVLQHHVVHGYAGNPISTDLKGYDGLVIMGGACGCMRTITISAPAR